MAIAGIVILLCIFARASGSQNDGPDPSLTSGYLQNLGKRAGSNILQLLGTAFADIEQDLTEQLRNLPIDTTKGMNFRNQSFHSHVCDLMECTDWSDWSPCVYEGRDEFGYAKKFRQCGLSNSLCTYHAETARNESRSRVCSRDILNCPSNYMVIHAQGQSFCLRFDLSSEQQHAATSVCESEGGHIVNINSPVKIDAVIELMEGSSQTIWVNGLRSDPTVDWTYTYGGIPLLEHWARGEPSNSYSQNCKVEENYPRELFDRDCDYSYRFVCEIVM